MALQTATNPQTGERIVLINGQWVPFTQSATNTQGQKAFLVNNQWVFDQSAVAKPEPEEESGFLRQAADVPLGLAKGAVSGVRMVADAFGANSPVSQTIKGAEDYLAGLMSAESRKDSQEIARIMQDAEDKGMGEQVKAALQAFMTAPVDLLAQGLGTAAPVVLSTLGAKVLGAGALATKGIGLGLGAGMGAGVTKGTIYEETKKALLEAKVPEEQAEARAQLAQSYGGENLDMILAGTALGGLASTTGIEKALAGPLARGILARAGAAEGAEQAAQQGLARRVATGALTESVPEVLQAGQEQLAANIALQREGFDVDTMRGVVGAAALEGLVGAGLGAGVGAIPSGTTAQQPPPPPREEPLPETPEAPIPPAATAAPEVEQVSTGVITAEDIDAAGVDFPRGFLPFVRRNILGKTRSQLQAEVEANPELIEGEAPSARLIRTLLQPQPAADQFGVGLPVQQPAGAPTGIGAPEPGAVVGAGRIAQPPVVPQAPVTPTVTEIPRGTTTPQAIEAEAQGQEDADAEPFTDIELPATPEESWNQMSQETRLKAAEQAGIANPKNLANKNWGALSKNMRGRLEKTIASQQAVPFEETTPRQAQPRRPSEPKVPTIRPAENPQNIGALPGTTWEPGTTPETSLVSEGAVPFRNKTEARAARRLQPDMRVIKVPGGFVLSPKTEAQMEADRKAGERLGRARVGEAGRPLNAMQFIVDAGGLNRSAANNVPGVDPGRNLRVGNRFLVTQNGMSLDKAAELLKQNGYIDEESEAAAANALGNPNSYTPEGFNRLIEIEQAEREAEDAEIARMEEEEMAQWADFVEDPDSYLNTGYEEALAEIKAEVREILDRAEELNIDPEEIYENANARARERAQQRGREIVTEEDYFLAANEELRDVLSRSPEDRRPRVGQPRKEVPDLELAPPTPEAQAEAERRAAQAPADQEREQIRRESEVGAGQFRLEGGEGRQDISGTLFQQEGKPVQFYEDIPNESWLQGKIDYAQKSPRNEFGVPKMSSTTGYFNQPVLVPARFFEGVRGQRGEQDNVRQDSLSAIRKIIRETGKMPLMDDGTEYVPYVEIAYNGTPYISEGNHRIMAAIAEGMDYIPVELRYFDGGQRNAGKWKPENLIEITERVQSERMEGKLQQRTEQGGWAIDPEEQKLEKELKGKDFMQVAQWVVDNAPNAFAKTIATKVQARLKEFQRRGVALDFRLHTGDRRPLMMSNARGSMTWAAAKDKPLSLTLNLNGAAAVENQSGYPPGMRYQTILHELLHGATAVQIHFMKDSPLVKQLNDLRNTLVKEFNARQKKGTLTPFEQKIYNRSINALQNNDEVLAWGMTDRDMQEFMAGIKVGEKSLFDKFVEIIEKILNLGRPYRSALEDLIRTGDALLDISTDEIAGAVERKTYVFGPTNPRIDTTGMQQGTLFQQTMAASQTETPAFKRWFGDSKVVDKQGRPLVVYHGTAKDFSEFDVARLGDNTREESGELGFFFTSKNFLSDSYADIASRGGWSGKTEQGSPVVYPVFLSIQNPKRYNTASAFYRDADKYKGRLNEWRAELQSQGYDGVIVRDDFEEVIAFSPNQIKSAIGNRGTFAPEISNILFQQESATPEPVREVQQSPNIQREAETLEQKAARENIFGGAVLSSWDTPTDTKLFGMDRDHIIYKLQNKQIDTKRVLDAIRKSGKDIAAKWDAYLQETLYHGRTAKRTQDYLKDELEKQVEVMQKYGLTKEEVGTYLHNRHAPEANAMIAERNPKFQDGGSGIETQKAIDYMNNLEPQKRKQLEEVAKLIDKSIENMQNELVRDGLESPDTIQTWREMFQYYIPLARVDADFDTTKSMSQGAGYSTSGDTTKSRVGSNKAVNAGEILANLAMQRERAIVRGEKNKVSNALYGLALQNPNPGFWLALDPTTDPVWKVGREVETLKDSLNSLEEILASGNVSKSEEAFYEMEMDLLKRLIRRKQKEASKAIAQARDDLQSMGLDPDLVDQIMKPLMKARYDKTRNEVVYEPRSPIQSEGVLATRFNGEEKYVLFNTNDPRAKRMVESLKNMDTDQLGTALNIMSKITRWFAAVNTQYNPVFGAYNFLRDVQTGLIQVNDTPIADKKREVVAGTMPAIKAIYQSTRKRRKGEKVDTEWANLWEEFQKEGGQTGFRDVFSQSDERATAIQRMIDPSSWSESPLGKVFTANGTLKMPLEQARKVGAPIFDWLSDYNDTMENAIRLSAYKAAKNKFIGEGMDATEAKQRAAAVAKDLTVNFNRKGQIANQAGALYAFFNASVQGTTRMFQLLNSPIGRKIAAGAFLLGSMQALLLAAAGFDDEEPPDFVKQRNYIIPTGDGKYIAFPMPLGFNVLPNTTRVITEWALSGFEDTPRRVLEITDAMFDMFNPIGNAGWSFQSIAPTMFDPAVALFENKDWTGKPISRKDLNQLDPTPGYTRSKDNASWLSEQLSEFLNFASGGDQARPGIISPTADDLDYLIGQFTGGVGREALKVMKTTQAAVTGEELPSYNVPLFGRFYGNVTGLAPISNAFYRNMTELNIHKRAIENLREEKGDVQAYLKENPEARMAQIAGTQYREIQKLRKTRRELLEKGEDERAKKLEEQIKTRMTRFNERFEKLGE